MFSQSRFFTFAALAASASLSATPVAAAQFPLGEPRIETGASEHAGWGRYRHRNRVDAGDVIAGVLVIGAIAAIAGSASNSSRERDRRREEERYRERDEYRTPARANYQGNSRGIDGAVAMCVEQVERGRERVGSVDNASRTGDGWRVSGALDDGAGWNCWIDNDGRIRQVDLGGAQAAGAGYAPGDRQLSDTDYARARAAQRGGGAVDANIASTPASDPQPAYPGGPLPGEEGYDEAVQLSTL